MRSHMSVMHTLTFLCSTEVLEYIFSGFTFVLFTAQECQCSLQYRRRCLIFKLFQFKMLATIDLIPIYPSLEMCTRFQFTGTVFVQKMDKLPCTIISARFSAPDMYLELYIISGLLTKYRLDILDLVQGLLYVY